MISSRFGVKRSVYAATRDVDLFVRFGGAEFGIAVLRSDGRELSLSVVVMLASVWVVLVVLVVSHFRSVCVVRGLQPWG